LEDPDASSGFVGRKAVFENSTETAPWRKGDEAERLFALIRSFEERRKEKRRGDGEGAVQQLR
jgi:hypothetical protein